MSQQTYKIENMDEDNKDILFNIIYDLQNGIQEPVIMETYKRQILNADGDRDEYLADWMVLNAQYDDDIMDWFNEVWVNKSREKEFNDVVKQLRWLDNSQKEQIIKMLQEQIKERV